MQDSFYRGLIGTALDPSIKARYRPSDSVFSPPAPGERLGQGGGVSSWKRSRRSCGQPALQAAKIPGHVGWHSLRHTFGTLMKANGEDIKTIQELLRHANYKVTADTYTQVVTPTKRAAQTRLVKMILPVQKAAAQRG